MIDTMSDPAQTCALMTPPVKRSIPQPGEVAPPFEAFDGNGNAHALYRYRGKQVVLFFYPRDNTPGCTKEVCQFRDRYPALQAQDTVVLGVSADTAAAHQKFASRHKLPFPLLVDESQTIVKAYGVWALKSFMGRQFMGILRTTFLISAEGRILNVWERVKPDGHGEEVLAAVAGR